MNILVAGGAGLIGSHLVERSVGDGAVVTVVDNFITGSRRNLDHLAGHPLLTIVEADVSQPLPPAVVAMHFDRIYHLASPASPVAYGRYPVQTLLANSAGTQHLLELAVASGARFLLASTSEVYGDPEEHPQKESYWGHVNPSGVRSCYDEGKRFAESMAMTYHRTRELDVRIARIFNTYGPRSDLHDGRVIPNFIVQALTGEPLTVYGDGTHTRSLCYVSDLVRGLVALMETEGLAGETINLGNPVEHEIKNLAGQIVALTGSRSEIVYKELPNDDPARRRPDIAKARRLLGWEPMIDLTAGLLNTIPWFQAKLGAVAPSGTGQILIADHEERR